MIYTYSELKNNGLDNYNINRKVANKELYKIESGLYSDLEDKSILLLFDKLNQIDDGIKIIVNKKIKSLKHQDYHGKRVNIVLKDAFGNQIETKIDIEVHNNLDIEQEEYMFNFEVFNNSMTLLINTKEQIFVKKLLFMLKHGIRTTRYKDIYDFYYLRYAIVKSEIEKIIKDKVKDERYIQRKLDEMLDILLFYENDDSLLLFRRLCKYYCSINPMVTAQYITYYR